MCTNKLYALQIKKEFDLKYKKTGKRSNIRVLGSVKNVNNGDYDLLPKLPEPNVRFMYDLIKIPCGQCASCRLQKIKSVAIQSTCEAQYWDEFGNGNSFITLTFGDKSTYEYLLKRYDKKGSSKYYHAKRMTNFLTWSLESREFQLFMKKLRKEVSIYFPEKYKDLESNLRFLHCGEYGEKNNRPHHHAIIFNFDFPDKYYWKTDKSTGEKYYRSPMLERCWPFGISLISNTSYNTCRYVAGYVMKKYNGRGSDEHYCGRKPEFRTSSNRPGLGTCWFNKYGITDVLSQDTVNLRNWKGKSVVGKPPKYFDKLTKDKFGDEALDVIKDLRKIKMLEFDKQDNYATDIANSIKSQRIKDSMLNVFRNNDLDDDDSILFDELEFYRKGGSFGISKSVLDSNTESYKKYLSNKSYLDYFPRKTKDVTSRDSMFKFYDKVSEKYCLKDNAKAMNFFERIRDKFRNGFYDGLPIKRKKRTSYIETNLDTLDDLYLWRDSYIEASENLSAPYKAERDFNYKGVKS